MTLSAENIKEIGTKCQELLISIYQAVAEELKKPEYKELRLAVNLNKYTLALYG